MSFTELFPYPFYLGGGVSTDVPGKWDCALAGHPFLIDWKNTYVGVTRFDRQSISLLKPQQDNSGNVSEASLNPEEFARRGRESWHMGAGQTYFDRTESDSNRFRSSKGVDPSTKWQLSLLPDTTSTRGSVNTNLLLIAAGARLYMTDGTGVRYGTDATLASAATGLPAAAPTGICTDGYNVYTTHSASGIYSSNTGTGAFASYNPRAANGICAYVKGRLIVSNDNLVLNITGAGTETSLVPNAPSNFRWVGAAEGPSFIYLAGYQGDKSLIYKTAIKADGTALDVAAVAGELPDGEVVRSVQGYLSMLLVGTDKGVRVFQLDAAGNLAGSSKVIPTPNAVYCFEPQDRFVWFGWTNYDSVSTGLGRLDLGNFTDPLTPAWWSDLMCTSQGAVQSVVTFGGVRVFTVSGLGVQAESTNKVASGSLDSGLITYGLPDPKVAMSLDVHHRALVGTVAAALALDESTSFTTIGTNTVAGSTFFYSSAGQVTAQAFEVRLTLTRSAALTTGPTVTRWTLEASPAPGRGETFDVPLLLFEKLERDGKSAGGIKDIPAEYDFLLSLEELGAPFPYQDAMGSQTVFLDDHQWLVDSRTANDANGYNGTFIAHLRRPRRRS